MTSYSPKAIAFEALKKSLTTQESSYKINASINGVKQNCSVFFSGAYIREAGHSRAVLNAKDIFDSTVRDYKKQQRNEKAESEKRN